MKKIYYIVSLLLLSLLFTSCGGLHNSSSIHARDYIREQNFSIKMYVRKAGSDSPSMPFAIDKNLDELALKIEKINSSLSTATYQDKFILIQTKSNFFMIEQIDKLEKDKKRDFRYWLFSPIGTFASICDSTTHMYIPYHLITGITVHHYSEYDNPYPKTLTCEALGTMDEFYDFYDHIAYCRVEKEEDRLLVTSEKNECTMEVSLPGDGTVTFSIMQVYSYQVQP